MYRSGDVGFMGFISEDIAISGNEIVSNTGDKHLELNNRVHTFITLPGRFKTIEKIFTIASWSQQNKYQKPIGLLNVNNFYSLPLFFIDGAVL